jgi:hypothetical protein
MGNSISQHQLTALLTLKAGQFFVGVKSCLAAAMSCLSLFGLFSLNSEIMEKVKPKPESASVPAAEFVWRLAEEATAFQVVNAVEVKGTRADERNVEWDKVITVAVLARGQILRCQQVFQHVVNGDGLCCRGEPAGTEHDREAIRQRLHQLVGRAARSDNHPGPELDGFHT